MEINLVNIEAVGDRIKRLRMMHGLSQRELSTDHVTFAYISRIEAGQRVPSEKALRELAPKLQTTPHYLESGQHYGECPHCYQEVVAADEAA